MTSSRLDLGLPEDWARLERCMDWKMEESLVQAKACVASGEKPASTVTPVANWSEFTRRNIPKKPTTRINRRKLEELGVGCPRNNQFFFVPTETTEIQSVSIVFRFVSRNQKTFFSVCFGVLDRY
jgi:hypothetical protein